MAAGKKVSHIITRTKLSTVDSAAQRSIPFRHRSGLAAAASAQIWNVHEGCHANLSRCLNNPRLLYRSATGGNQQSKLVTLGQRLGLNTVTIDPDPGVRRAVVLSRFGGHR